MMETASKRGVSQADLPRGGFMVSGAACDQTPAPETEQGETGAPHGWAPRRAGREGARLGCEKRSVHFVHS